MIKIKKISKTTSKNDNKLGNKTIIISYVKLYMQNCTYIIASAIFPSRTANFARVDLNWS